MVFALIALAILRSRSGWIARSRVATRYQLGLALQAGADTFPPRAAVAGGGCGTKRIACSLAVRSCAKSSFTPASVSLTKPYGSGRIAPFTGAGFMLPLKEPADCPKSGAKAAI